MKWLLIVSGAVVGLLLVLWLGMRAYYAFVVNDQVAQELIENPQGDRARLVMLLTFPDGRELPVNYLREGNQVFVGADGRWWREFREGNIPVKVFIQGEQYGGRGRAILDDPEYTRSVFERLRPNVPDWLPDWLDAYLIVIDLDV